jgi:arabinose-5-phosphate isomerase
MKDILKKADEVLGAEIEGLQFVRDNLDSCFVRFVTLCLKTLDQGGKIVLCGVGKSGHIGKKIASTLASTGSPAAFLHPVEALHGDLGVIQSGDILVALSYSGETEEVLEILPAVRRLDIPVVAITGFPQSRLAGFSDVVVPMTVPREACPFNLAPTTSTTALLALGDALALILLDIRGFTREDYGRLHPGGAIGRAVTLQVSGIMRREERLALVGPDSTIKQTIFRMTASRSGSAVIVDENGKLLGIFTDGDFRRHAENCPGIMERKVADVMTCNPASVRENDLAVEILKIIEKRKIDDIIVLDSADRVVGLVDIQDLPGMKLM